MAWIKSLEGAVRVARRHLEGMEMDVIVLGFEKTVLILDDFY